MSDEIDEAVAKVLADFGTDYHAALRAYGDQREREALKKVVAKLESEVTRQLKDDIKPELNIVAPVLKWAIHATLALISKATP